MTNLQDFKVCNKCNKEKRISDFGKCKRFGYKPECRECWNSYKTRLRRRFSKKNVIEDLPDEIWVEAIGFKGMYVVSNRGRIKSTGFYYSNGSKSIKPVCLLKSKINKAGYHQQSLGKKTVLIHIVEYFSFHPELEIKKGYVVDHKDENKLNNDLENLQYVTQSFNVQKSNIIRGNKTSKYVGVSFDKSKNKWIAQIRIEGKSKKLGAFSTEEAAASEYLANFKY